MIPFSKYRCMNGYTIRIGSTVTIEIVYLIVFAFSTFVAAAPEIVPAPEFIIFFRLEAAFRYVYSLCCSVCSWGASGIRIRESVKEFQLPTAPKIAIVARIGLLSGHMIFTKIVI